MQKLLLILLVCLSARAFGQSGVTRQDAKKLAADANLERYEYAVFDAGDMFLRYITSFKKDSLLKVVFAETFHQDSVDSEFWEFFGRELALGNLAGIEQKLHSPLIKKILQLEKNATLRQVLSGNYSSKAKREIADSLSQQRNYSIFLDRLRCRFYAVISPVMPVSHLVSEDDCFTKSQESTLVNSCKGISLGDDGIYVSVTDDELREFLHFYQSDDGRLLLKAAETAALRTIDNRITALIEQYSVAKLR